MATRLFNLSDLLFVTTGRLVSSRHIDGVYDILNFLTGDNLFTHQLPRAAEFARPRLLAQLPSLATADVALLDDMLSRSRTAETVAAWVEVEAVRLGNSFELAPLDGWQVMDPIAEIIAMRGPTHA